MIDTLSTNARGIGGIQADPLIITAQRCALLARRLEDAPLHWNAYRAYIVVAEASEDSGWTRDVLHGQSNLISVALGLPPWEKTFVHLRLAL